MPSLLSPVGTSSNSRAYTPLADEFNYQLDNGAPMTTVTRNGTVVYTKRAGSESSRSGSSTPHRVDSDEALGNGYPRPSLNGAAASDGEEHDIGDMKRTPKGKGKERAWDVEEVVGLEKTDSYPPMNEHDEEERRVQNVRDIPQRPLLNTSEPLSLCRARCCTETSRKVI